MTNSTAPPPRKHHTLVLDAPNGRALLWGGEFHDHLWASDTVWSLNLSTLNWSPIVVSWGPAARHGHSAVMLSSPARMVVLTGSTNAGTDDQQVANATNEIWELNLSGTPAWTNRTPSSGSMPCPRWHSQAVLTGNGTILLFGGKANAGTSATPLLTVVRDSWLVLPSTASGPWSWTFLDGGCHDGGQDGVHPEHRYKHVMVTGEGTTTPVYTFGGVYLDDVPVNNLYRSNSPSGFTSSTNPWVTTSMIDNSTNGYSRAEHAAIYDPVTSPARMVVFGGVDPVLNVNNPVTSNTLFAMSLPSSGSSSISSISTCGTAPGPRKGHAMIYDAAHDRIVMFGGSDASGNLMNDTWTLEFTPAAPAASNDLAITGHNSSTLTVQWQVPVVGGPVTIDMHSSASPMHDLTSFNSATSVSTSPSSYTPGTTATTTITVPNTSVARYYAMRVTACSGGTSGVSSNVCAKLNPYVECFEEGATYSMEETPRAATLTLDAPARAAGAFDVQFGLPDRAGATLELVDVAGRVVERHVLDAEASGHGVVRVGTAASLRSGWYALRLRNSTASLSRPVMVVR